MKDLAAVRVRYGYRRIRILLNREGWQAGKYLVYRLYKEEGLSLRKKLPKRRKMIVQREARICSKKSTDVQNPASAWC